MKAKKIMVFLCLGLMIFCLGLTALGQKSKGQATGETLEQAIFRHARNYGIDGRLLQSLIYTESVFRSRAVSNKGAACYTQLMPGTARRFGLIVNAQYDERFNSEKCLDTGAKYLNLLLRLFRGDVRLALAGYNAGEGAVIKFGWKIPPYRETVQYVEKICALYYGQSGHAVAMAYNQPLAQYWVNALYNGAKPRIVNTAYVRQITSQNQSFLPKNENQASPVSNVKVEENKKPAVLRVNVEQTALRIRTESLTFGNWEK